MSGHSTALRDRSPCSCQNPMAAHVFKFKYKCLCSSNAYLLEISAPEVFVCWRSWPNRCFPASLPRTGLPPRACRVPAPPEQPRALPAGRGLHALNRAPAALPAARLADARGGGRQRAREPPGQRTPGESSGRSPRAGDARERSPAPSARRGPAAAARPPLGGAGRAERPGPAAAPASASSPSVPCLLPPPGGRLRGAGGREGARPKGVAGREV